MMEALEWYERFVACCQPPSQTIDQREFAPTLCLHWQWLHQHLITKLGDRYVSLFPSAHGALSFNPGSVAARVQRARMLRLSVAGCHRACAPSSHSLTPASAPTSRSVTFISCCGRVKVIPARSSHVLWLRASFS